MNGPTFRMSFEGSLRNVDGGDGEVVIEQPSVRHRCGELLRLHLLPPSPAQVARTPPIERPQTTTDYRLRTPIGIIPAALIGPFAIFEFTDVTDGEAFVMLEHPP